MSAINFPGDLVVVRARAKQRDLQADDCWDPHFGVAAVAVPSGDPVVVVAVAAVVVVGNVVGGYHIPDAAVELLGEEIGADIVVVVLATAVGDPGCDPDSTTLSSRSIPMLPTDHVDCVAVAAGAAADGVSAAVLEAFVTAAVRPTVVAAADGDCLHGTFDCSIDSSKGVIATAAVDAASENGAVKVAPQYLRSTDGHGGIAVDADAAAMHAAALVTKYLRDPV